MLFPYGDDTPRVRTPYVHNAILIANLVIHLWVMSLGPIDRLSFFQQHGLVPAHPALVDFLTSLFLHADVFHLAGNMLFLWIVGDNVEDKLGHLGYAAFYFGSGIAAGLTHMLIDPSSSVPLIGASGAVSGVLGAYLVFFPRNDIKIFILWFPLRVRTLRVSAVVAILCWFGMQLVEWFFARLGGQTSVAYGAHVGGFCAGVVPALLLARAGVHRMEVRRQPLDSQGVPDLRPRLRKEPSRRVLPADEEVAIRQALAEGSAERAGDLYLALRFTRGGHILPAALQIEVAGTLKKLGWSRYATEAYRSYLDRYPTADHAVEALVSLAEIHGRSLAEYHTALSYLRRARKAEPDESTHSRLEEIDSEITQHLARVVPEEETVEGRAAVFRQTTERIDPGRFGRIVTSVTGEPLADATRRLTRGRIRVASDLSARKAKDLARRLQRAGLSVLVVEEERLVDLPPVRIAKAFDLRPDGVAASLVDGGEIVRPWLELYLVVGAWTEGREKPPGPGPVPGSVDSEFWEIFGTGVVNRPFRVRRTERTGFFDLFVLNPWIRIRVGAGGTTFRGRPIQLRRAARLLLRHARSVSMNDGVYMMADRGDRASLTFERGAHLDEYETWLLQLEEFNRTE